MKKPIRYFLLQVLLAGLCLGPAALSVRADEQPEPSKSEQPASNDSKQAEPAKNDEKKKEDAPKDDSNQGSDAKKDAAKPDQPAQG